MNQKNEIESGAQAAANYEDDDDNENGNGTNKGAAFVNIRKQMQSGDSSSSD